MKDIGINIIDFRLEYQGALEYLNRQWIEKSFRLEPSDLSELSDPLTAFIRPGGAILMAVHHQEMVGTVALKKVSATNFELAKLAVREDYQRQGIGEALCRSSIVKAQSLGATRITLFSHHSLKAALQLYHKLGFLEVQMEKTTYTRADVQMVLSLELPTMDQGNADQAQWIASGSKNFSITP